MFLNIDYNKSINKNKIIFNQTMFEKILDFLGINILHFSFPVLFIIALFLTFNEKRYNEDNFVVLIFFLLASTISLFLFIKWLNILVTKRINGINAIQNRTVTQNILKTNNWKILKDNNNFLIAQKSFTGFSWNKQLTIVYDGSDILVNVISLGLFDFISPIHFSVNKRESKIIEEAFLNNIKTNV